MARREKESIGHPLLPARWHLSSIERGDSRSSAAHAGTVFCRISHFLIFRYAIPAEEEFRMRCRSIVSSPLSRKLRCHPCGRKTDGRCSSFSRSCHRPQSKDSESHFQRLKVYRASVRLMRQGKEGQIVAALNQEALKQDRISMMQTRPSNVRRRIAPRCGLSL